MDLGRGQFPREGGSAGPPRVVGTSCEAPSRASLPGSGEVFGGKAVVAGCGGDGSTDALVVGVVSCGAGPFADARAGAAVGGAPGDGEPCADAGTRGWRVTRTSAVPWLPAAQVPITRNNATAARAAELRHRRKR